MTWENSADRRLGALDRCVSHCRERAQIILLCMRGGRVGGLGAPGWRSQSQCGRIGLQMKPIELGGRLGRWSSGRGPLPVLLAARIRRLIDEGELPPGEPLPPDRALASALAVGRSTVVAAYDLLRRDGRIVRRQGSGTLVAGTARAAARPTTGAPLFLHLLEPRDGVIQLTCAAPGTPPPELAEAYTAIVPMLAGICGDIGYHPMGHPVLRAAIAERYTRRGIRTGPDRILVTNGAQQALSLLARAFLTPGAPVLVEAPTYHGALEAFRDAAAVLRALPVGLAGLEMAARQHRPALAYRDLRRLAVQDRLGWAAHRMGARPRAGDRPARAAAGRARPRREHPRSAGRRRPAATAGAVVAAPRNRAQSPP